MFLEKAICILLNFLIWFGKNIVDVIISVFLEFFQANKFFIGNFSQ